MRKVIELENIALYIWHIKFKIFYNFYSERHLALSLTSNQLFHSRLYLLFIAKKNNTALLSNKKYCTE